MLGVGDGPFPAKRPRRAFPADAAPPQHCWPEYVPADLDLDPRQRRPSAGSGALTGSAVLTQLASYNQDNSVSAMGEVSSTRSRELDACMRMLGPYHPDTLRAANDLASVLQSQGQHAAAQALCRQALEGRRRVLGPHHPDTLTSTHNLAVVLQSQGLYDEAVVLYGKAAEGRQRLLGWGNAEALASVTALAEVLRTLGRCEEEQALLEKTLERLRPDEDESVTASEPAGTRPHAQVAATGKLAAALRLQGQLDLAHSLYERILEHLRIAVGPCHPDTLSAANDLASVLHSQGQHAAAQALCRQALEGRRRVLGPHHPDTLTSTHNLAVVLQSQGLYDEAVVLFNKAAEGRQRVLGPNHPDSCQSTTCLERLMAQQQQQQRFTVRQLTLDSDMLVRQHKAVTVQQQAEARAETRGWLPTVAMRVPDGPRGVGSCAVAAGAPVPVAEAVTAVGGVHISTRGTSAAARKRRVVVDCIRWWEGKRAKHDEQDPEQMQVVQHDQWILP